MGLGPGADLDHHAGGDADEGDQLPALARGWAEQMLSWGCCSRSLFSPPCSSSYARQWHLLHHHNRHFVQV